MHLALRRLQPQHRATVLAHLPSPVKGTGNKGDDFHAMFGCATATTFSTITAGCRSPPTLLAALRRTQKHWFSRATSRSHCRESAALDNIQEPAAQAIVQGLIFLRLPGGSPPCPGLRRVCFLAPDCRDAPYCHRGCGRCRVCREVRATGRDRDRDRVTGDGPPPPLGGPLLPVLPPPDPPPPPPEAGSPADPPPPEAPGLP